MAYARAVGQAELRTRLRARARAAGARDEEGEDGGEEEDDDDDDEEEEEEAEEEALLAEAEGLKLHLSSGSTTGYKGVRKHTQQTGRFEARRYEGSRTIYIGVFDSAVEAAVAYAVGERRT